MIRRLTLTLTLLVLAPFTLAACGGDEEESSESSSSSSAGGGAGGALAVSAVPDGSFAFEQTSLEAAAGQATIEFENPASLGHDLCLEQDGSEVGFTEVISDDSTTLEADLEGGEYTYYCSVAGHREGGMEGTLTVE